MYRNKDAQLYTAQVPHLDHSIRCLYFNPFSALSYILASWVHLCSLMQNSRPAVNQCWCFIGGYEQIIYIISFS